MATAKNQMIENNEVTKEQSKLGKGKEKRMVK
jgi:hypothetical protein